MNKENKNYSMTNQFLVADINKEEVEKIQKINELNNNFIYKILVASSNYLKEYKVIKNNNDLDLKLEIDIDKEDNFFNNNLKDIVKEEHYKDFIHKEKEEEPKTSTEKTTTIYLKEEYKKLLYSKYNCYKIQNREEQQQQLKDIDKQIEKMTTDILKFYNINKSLSKAELLNYDFKTDMELLKLLNKYDIVNLKYIEERQATLKSKISYFRYENNFFNRLVKFIFTDANKQNKKEFKDK